MIIRDFYADLKNAEFKPVTFGIFNKLDDDGVIEFLKNTLKEVFSIDEFDYYDFQLSDKEVFLVKMYNKEYNKNITKLKNKIEQIIGAKVYVLRDEGIVRVVKLNKININDLCV